MYSKTQSSEVNYELHTLGWKSFQHLCITIFSEVLKYPIQEFFTSHDGGRDGAFRGEWEVGQNKIMSGSFTIQCKFTSKPHKQLKLSDLKDEIAKVERLAKKGFCDHYIICTNMSLIGVDCEKIETRFTTIPEIKNCTIYGKETLSGLIRDHDRLRMLIPRVYGLGDLGQILDERAYNQARAILSSMGDDLKKFVITESYKNSLKAIEDEGFVLLLGEPACGKSTIASILAMGALDRWKCHTIKCNNPNDFSTHYNVHEKQFFWIDDAFGATQLSQEMTSQWNYVFPMINSAIKQGSKFVFTSRDYIYRSAKIYLKETALPLIKESQVVIEVKKLTVEEKEQILYNHIKLGNQPTEYKKRLKPFLNQISNNSNFTPEIARRLGNKEYTKNLFLTQSNLDNFINHPMDFLKDILTNIDRPAFAALVLIFIHNGVLLSPIRLNDNDNNAIKRIGADLVTILSLFKTLNETFVKLEIRDNNNVWVFKHPTLRDAIASIIAEDPELLDIYLSGTPINTIFDEVSCENISQQQGIKITIPESRYDQLIARINSATLPRASLNSFLAHRCSSDFLKNFILTQPDFINSITLTTYNRDSEYNLINTLFTYNLLPEEKRLTFIAELTNWAIDLPKADFLNDFIIRFVKREEKNIILEKVKIELLPNLSEIISDRASEFNKDEDYPDDHFYDIENALGSYLYEFEYNVEDEASVAIIETALEKIKEEIKNLPQKEEYDEEEKETPSFTNNVINKQQSNRSIFDDVDE